MQEPNYSKEIAKVVSDVLAEDRYEFKFDEATGVFSFDYEVFEVDSEIELYAEVLEYIITACENVILMHAISSRKIYYNTKRKTMEYINRVNSRLQYCKFELSNYDKGEFRVTTFHKCEEGRPPSQAIVRDMIHALTSAMEDYGAGFTDLQFEKGLTAKEALENCETIKMRRLAAQKEAEAREKAQAGNKKNQEGSADGGDDKLYNDEEKREAREAFYAVCDFYHLMHLSELNNEPITEDYIEIAKQSAQVLKNMDVFDFNLENDTVFFESMRKFMQELREGIERYKKIEALKRIRAALNGDDSDTDAEEAK